MPDGHLAHMIYNTVRDLMDLPAYLGSYDDEPGHPLYHLAMMTALLERELDGGRPPTESRIAE